jgi:hypothetical protein
MKQWWKSKTVWFNVLTVTLGVLGAIQGVLRNQTAIIVFVGLNALGNWIIRLFFTSTAIGTPATPTAASADPAK